MSHGIKLRTFSLLIFLTVLGGFLHFYNLNWGKPYYFHPDERNIASSVSQLQFPTQMNPHFFAYGSLPIYTIYFTGILFNFIQLQTSGSKLAVTIVSFNDAIAISRFYSAIFSTMLIPLLYVIAKNIETKQPAHDAHASKKQLYNFGREERTGLFAAALATFSVGFIQFAHFGTFEMWLTFFSAVLFWLCLKTIKSKRIVYVFLLGLVFGVLFATKVSHLALLPLPLFAIIIHYRNALPREFTKNKTSLLWISVHFFTSILIFFLTAALIYIATNPFVFRDYASFRNSMQYESSVALGTEPVFYTGEFFDKFPVVFQFLHIYPFLVNPLLTIIFIPSLLFLMLQIVKSKNISILLLVLCFVLLFFSQAVLFAKWTRYMMPTLPFLYLIITVSIAKLGNFFFNNKPHLNLLLIEKGLVVSASIIFSLSYFITAFVEPDTRLRAVQFTTNHMPADSPILSEVFDLGITAFNVNFHNITLFNFYDLDTYAPDSTPQILQTKLQQSDYIILPSQRLLKTRLLNKKLFPEGNRFYTQLLNGSLGFRKIYETPCDIFCTITYLGNPVYSFEETANVFDRPEVYIFKKV